MSGAQNGSIRDTTGANSAVETADPPPLQVTRILRRQTWSRAKKMRFLYVLLVLPVVLLLHGSGDSGAAQDCRDGARTATPKRRDAPARSDRRFNIAEARGVALTM